MKKILAILLTLGIFLRVIDINNNPRGLYGDEVTLLYDAYSILKTSYDQRGNFLPLTFELGASRPPFYVYATIPFIAILGPTILAIKILSIISGLGIALLIYYLGKKWVSEKVGLLAAMLVIFSPWDLSVSRGGFETHLALFLSLIGITGFVKAAENPRWFILSAIGFGLTFHTYSVYKLVTPLFIPLLIWFYKDLFAKGKSIYKISFFGILACFAIVLMHQVFFAGSEGRFISTNAFSSKQIQEYITQKVNYDRSITTLSPYFHVLFHNKVVEYAFVLGKSYINNFSVNFLFLTGDGNPRHNLTTMGMLYFVEIVTVMLGFFWFAIYKKRMLVFLTVWLLIAPIPAALLLESHALRDSFLIPPLILLSAAGLFYLLQFKKANLIKWLVLTGFFIQFAFLVNRLYFVSPNEFGNFWSYPARLASNLAIRNTGKYQYIFLSEKIDNIEYAYPTFAKIDPNLVISQNKIKTSLGGLQFRKYGNVFIGSIQPTDLKRLRMLLNGSILYIGSISNKEGLTDYQTVKNSDNSDALVIKDIK